jgi:outer membrane protein assembly factor BamB
LGQFVVAASIGGTVYFMDRNNGKIIWIFAAQSPIFSNIVSAVANNNESFYFGADNGIFYCITAAGQEKWRFKTNGKIRGEALIHNSTIYFGSYDNHLYALDLASGKLKFKYATEGYIEGKPIIMDNSLYFGSGDSFLYNLHS